MWDKGLKNILACILVCVDTISGMRAEACRRGASENNEDDKMLSRVFIGYGKMSDHVIYIPNSCLVPRSAPTREEWSMGGDGPSILGPAVYFSSLYREIRCPANKLNLPVIQEDPYCPAVYYARALTYAKSGLSRHENALNGLNDLNTALAYVKSETEALAILERRAEVYQAMGKLHEANDDYSKILDDNNCDPSLFMHRGSVLFLLEEYAKANADFEKSLESSPDQPVAMHYQALCLYNMGRLRDAVKVFQDILRLKPDYTEIIQSLGQAYQELGEFDLAIENFNKALAVDPSDARSYHYRGLLQYQHGDHDDSLKSFKTCLAWEPFNEQCNFMKGASLATLGQYYPAVKEFTKVMLMYPSNPDKPSAEHNRVMYLREWCRYMHCHLESNILDVSAEVDLPGAFREYWVNSQTFSFTFENYTEQPGIQPHIKDVEPKNWEDFSEVKQSLLCKAHHLGSWAHGTSVKASMGNRRLRTAMGMATLQIADTVTRHFKAVNHHKSKQFSWRIPFDIAVKWKRLVDANRPIMWLDQLPSSKLKPNAFIHQINLMKGDKYNVLYTKYIDEVVTLMKNLVREHTSATSSDEYKADLEKATDYESIMETVKKHHGSEVADTGFSLGTKVLSVKDRKRKHLDGFTLSLGSTERQNRSAFAINITTKRARTQQYHAELDFVWQMLTENMSKMISHKNNDDEIQESVVNSSLTLAYYFYNLMPISEGSGVISYATTLGLLLAIGKEVSGKIPSGKMMEMDALLAPSPEDFIRHCKSWMKIKRKGSILRKELPELSEILPTLRSCIEAVNINSAEYCT